METRPPTGEFKNKLQYFLPDYLLVPVRKRINFVGASLAQKSSKHYKIVVATLTKIFSTWILS